MSSVRAPQLGCSRTFMFTPLLEMRFDYFFCIPPSSLLHLVIIEAHVGENLTNSPVALMFKKIFCGDVEQPSLCDHKTTAVCQCWKRRLPAWNRQTMPDVVAGNIDVFRFANRMITGLEKQAGALRGFDWALVAGRTQLLRQWRQRCHSSGRQPGRGKCSAAWQRYWGGIQKHLGWWLGEME